MARHFRSTPNPTASNLLACVSALSDAVGYITAQTQLAIKPLDAAATNDQVIAKINEILVRLQGTA